MTPPSQLITVCEGYGTHHKPVHMKLCGLEDDGTHIWRCPKCFYTWREPAEIVAISRSKV